MVEDAKRRHAQDDAEPDLQERCWDNAHERTAQEGTNDRGRPHRPHRLALCSPISVCPQLRIPNDPDEGSSLAH